MEEIKKETNVEKPATERKKPGPKPKQPKEATAAVNAKKDEVEEVAKVEEIKEPIEESNSTVADTQAEVKVDGKTEVREDLNEGTVIEPDAETIKTECDKEIIEPSCKYPVGSVIEVVKAKSYRFADTFPEYFIGSFTGSVKVLGEVNGMIRGEICEGINKKTIRFFVITNE